MKSLPWISREIRVLMRARLYYLTKAKKSKRMEDWVSFKSVKNQLKQSLKKAKLEYFKRLSEQSARNPRKAWQEVSRLLGSGSRKEISVLRSEKGEITSQQEIADELGRFFSEIVGVTSESQEQSYSGNDPGLNGGCKVQFKFKEIEEGDVLKVLKTLDPNKAYGADEIRSKLIRMVAPGICQSLTSLFNSSLRSGQVPEEWKAANITPVPKKGNNDEVSNFRPVSVLPVVGKVFERLVHNQLYSYLQEHKMLDSAQFGFRPGHSTQDALLSMVEEWRVALDEDKLVGSVFFRPE